jgi:hypothetical protein
MCGVKCTYTCNVRATLEPPALSRNNLRSFLFSAYHSLYLEISVVTVVFSFLLWE